MPFALESDPSMSDVSGAINYILSNFATGLSSNAGTGIIVGPTGTVVGYLYKYMAIKYADNAYGSLNFSNVPTGRAYYGLRNSNDPAESTNPADYVWYQVTGGFGSTKFLYYIATGGRQINFNVATSLPDTGWVVDSGASIDLDIVTSGNVPVIAESFVSYFTPSTLQVPRSGSPLAPVFTGVTPVMYATNQGSVIPFTSAQTDSNVGFVNNSWRIGNSSTTGYGDISKTNITIDDPTDAGDYASWPAPTAMASSPAYLTVPVRYKNSLGVVTQASVSNLQFVFADPGANGLNGPSIDISGFTGFTQNAGGAFTPSNATLSAVTSNVTSPTYSWSISGGTPTSSTASSVVVAPNSSATAVVVTLTVNGSNLLSPSSKTISMPVVYNGAPGSAGSNGLMSAFPTIYQWTGSSAAPTRPTTTSTYTWATGAYTAPAGWSTTAPSNTTTGNYLWSLTYPLNASATTTTSTLDWTDTGNPIRAVAYNGTNGANGASASVLTLNTTGQTFTYNSAGSAAPTSQTITFTAVLQNLSGTPTFTATKYDASGTSIGSATLGGSGNVRTLSISDFGVANYCVVTASLGGFGDTITVVKLQDGAVGVNAISGFLTNESATVQANSAGTVSNFSQAGGLFKVFNGITDVSGVLSTYSVVSSTNVTISIDITGTYLITAMSANQGAATLRAVYNGVTIDKVYNIAKSIAGLDGANGTNGTRTAILEMYQWASTVPTTFPAGTSTYTWATGQFIAPGTPNSWTITPGSASTGQTLWVCRTVYADSNSTATTAITWTATSAYPSGVAGNNGSDGTNGYRTAIAEVYQWAATAPTVFPSGNSTYTWATGAFTAPGTPNGWSLLPGASTPGYTLYACSISYADQLTTSTSTLTWTTSTAYAIGASGTNGAAGSNGSNGSNGAATFVITRVANDSSAPTNAEVYALLGRNPVAGDIVTVSYNNYNNATIYRYVTSWVLFNTYITGSLIVQNTITGDKIAANTITGTNIAASTITASNISAATITGTQIAANTVTASNINSNNLTIKDGSGTVLFGAGTNLAAANIIPSSGWLNSNVTIGESSGVISLGGAGSGSVTAITTNNKITSSNISTYMSSAAIGTAYIGDAQITNSKIGNAAVNTLQIAGQAVTIPSSVFTSSSVTVSPGNIIQSITVSATGNPIFITTSVSYSANSTYFPSTIIFQIRRGSTVLYTGQGLFGPQDSFGNYLGSFAANITDTPSSGNQTYSLYFYSQGGDNSNSFNNISIMCLEVKR